MRNKILLSSVLLACVTSATYAGEMGPVESYAFKPFVLGEASYSSPQVKGMDITANVGHIGSDLQVQGWGGRLATGLTRQISERFALSFEGGLIYNDHIVLQPVVYTQGVKVWVPSTIMSVGFDQYGFDTLAGINFIRPKYDLFFKAGALFENLHTRFSVDTNRLLKGNARQERFTGGSHQSINTNVGQVMPEIKLGGAYHCNEAWSLTAAWMHAFGGTLSFASRDLNPTTGSFSIGGINLSLNNPTIDSVMFGIQYDFS